MVKNFWKIVNRVIDDADVVLEVLDSRTVDKTRNLEIEKKIEKSGKKLIYVINKCDLIEQDESERIKKELEHSVFTSAIERLGTRKLREKILACSSKAPIRVAVLGYPNTGKSSIINALKGKTSAKTSSQSGYTKGKQYIRVSKRILLIDTPGVFPYKEDDESKHAMTAARSTHDIRNPETAVLDLIDALKGRIEKHYDVEVHDDPEETLEAIAVKTNNMKKGGVADTLKTSKKVIHDWQTGKIL